MACILAVTKNIEVNEKASAGWLKYGVSTQRSASMHEAVERVKQNGDYFFIIIDEDSVPEYETLLPVMRCVTDRAVFVICSRCTVEKTIKAMSLGADAYLPFYDHSKKNVLLALEILKSRRRWEKRNDAGRMEVLCGGGMIISQPHRKVFIDDQEISLCKKEFDILHYLMLNSGRVMTHEQILKEIWGEIYEEKDVDVLWRTMNRIRNKLSKTYPANKCLKIERKVGYVFLPEIKNANEK